MINFDLAQVISLLIGVILPLLVGLVTKWETPSAFRAVLLLLLSAVSAFATEFLASLNSGTAFDVGATLLSVLGTFLVGVGMQFGIWRPTGASDAMKRVGSPNPPPPVY